MATRLVAARLILIVLVWEQRRYQNNDLLLPSFLQTFPRLLHGIARRRIAVLRVSISLVVLLKGYLIGIVLAFALTTLVSTQMGRDLPSTLTSMFNPLSAIALLPLLCCGLAWGRTARFLCWCTRCCGSWHSTLTGIHGRTETPHGRSQLRPQGHAL